MTNDEQLERATLEDVFNAVEPSGKKVIPPTAIAANLFNVPYEKVTNHMRNVASMRHQMYNTR